jgi:Cu(I)/Ag(I) efflux system membrane fusion protein
MAIVRWALVAIMALAAVGAWVHYGASAGVLGDASRFHCPMHPSIVMAQEGECPICGMDLVAVGRTGAAPETAAEAHAHAAAKALYVCPMDCVAGFETADPQARCPKCGMKLVAKRPSAPEHAEGVEGLVPVQLTLDRVQLAGMKTAVAAREALSPSVRTVGVVTPNEGRLVSVTTRFSGWAESVGVAQAGELVERGQVLASVYSPEMISAQQAFLNAVKWADRRPGAAGAAAPPQLNVDLGREARQRLSQLGLAAEDIEALARAGEPSQKVNVRAPIRGHVGRKNLLRGAYVQPGTELFQLADLSTVWVLADLYEADLGRVKVGGEATFELHAYPGERFRGRVQLVAPAVSPATRTLQVRLVLENPGLKLRPGMYGDVTLDVDALEGVVVPREAIVDTGELQYVFVSKEGGRFEPRRVRRGGETDGRVVLLEGVAEGERVVTTANFLLDSESRLRAAVEGSP